MDAQLYGDPARLPAAGAKSHGSWVYRAVFVVLAPVVRSWGRLDVVGVDALPRSGPVVVFANHDSAWDPFVIASAARQRRQIQALAKASLWRYRPMGWLMDGMGQIPIRRGEQDAGAMDVAIRLLTAGGCIGVFPEGSRSWGQVLRARSGAGRLVLAVPEAAIVCAVVTGSVDIARFPKRPRLRVHFFVPATGQPEPGELAKDVSERILAELRAAAPVALPGRRGRASRDRRLRASER